MSRPRCPAVRSAGCLALSSSRNSATAPFWSEERSGNDVIICLLRGGQNHHNHHLAGVYESCFELGALGTPVPCPVCPVQKRVLKPRPNGGKTAGRSSVMTQLESNS